VSAGSVDPLTRSGEPGGALLPTGRSGLKHGRVQADADPMSWWLWILIGWTVVAAAVAVPLGLAMREAERRERVRPVLPAVAPPVPSVTPTGVHAARRRLPAPPLALLLAGTGLALETVGFVLRAVGDDRTGNARLLSMDAPMSVPRMFVAALFLVAALAAFAGAVQATDRRTWWIAIGVVAALVAEVKGGGTVHVRALEALGVTDHPVIAFAGSAVIVGAVLASLFWVARTERRDRRRVLLAVAFYGLAAGGLSSVSTAVAQAFGSTSVWAAASTYVEESAEVVGAVAVLVAVLVGVAPRLVLPADWALRRTADAQTVDAPGVVQGWATDARTQPR
jgi:hypothetical protein